MTITSWRRHDSTRRRWRRLVSCWLRHGELLEARIALTGELSFADPLALPTGTNPEAMTVADLDGDGLMDLVTADFADSTVTVRYGTGGGEFSGARYHFVGQGPVDVVAADLDGRHGLDLITANMLTGDISVLLSTGQRRFAEEAHYETGEFTSGLAVADLNGDDLPDILVASAGVESIGKLSLLTGRPTAPGAFSQPVTIVEKWGSTSVVVAHFDQNNSLDLAIASDAFGDNDVAVLLGTSEGGFAPAVSYEAGNSPDRSVAADLNSDGYVDLAVNNWFSADVSVFLGMGDGTFDAAASYAKGLASESVAVADVDDDGILDLVTTGGSSVSVLAGRGDGTFQAPVSFPLTGSPTDVAVADLNNDGRLDLAVCTQNPSTFAVLLNTAKQVIKLPGAGGAYTQDFDHLGMEGDIPGNELPAGWTAVVAGREQRTITGEYPPQRTTADTFNAGPEGEPDRALALGDTGEQGVNQLQLEWTVTEQEMYALTLAFDLEVWGGDPALALDPGTATFQVELQIDRGDGFEPFVNLGTVSTGPSLSPSSIVILDGNTPPHVVHLLSDVVDAHVTPGTLLRFDLTIPDGNVGDGFIIGVDNVAIETLYPGDCNGDGRFDTADLVQVLRAGEYEDGITGNSTWSTGDWNGDGDFDTGDLVAALQTGRYEVDSRLNSFQVAAVVDWLFAQDQHAKRQRAYVASGPQ